MKELKNPFFFFLIISLVIGSFYSGGLAGEKWNQDDPLTDEWNMVDLLIARPIGIVAGIVGTGIFILSLPFTIPTNSVEKAANLFIERPFKFSFVREFPDDNM